jgi:hypothetical protein
MIISKPIRLSVCIIGLICLNSLTTQILLMAEHKKTSLLGLAIWTSIYVAVAYGLIKKKKAAHAGAIVVSILQMIPLLISRVAPISKLFELLPSWYVYTLYISAALGLALLITLIRSGNRGSSKSIE